MSSINSSGFKYYMERLGIDSASLAVAYDFTQNPSLNNGKVLPTTWSSGCYTGSVNGDLTNFFNQSGSGFLNGSNSIDINGTIVDNNFSFLFCYEKLKTGSEILLSSALGNSFSERSGITLGVNDANKLYLEYWGAVDGVFSATLPGRISNKNIVYFGKNSNNLNLGVFDPISSSLMIETKNLSNTSYVHSNQFRIGNRFNSWSSGNGFSGFFDDFYCFTGTAVPEDYLGVLCSGFYSTPNIGGASGIIESCVYFTVLSGSGVNLGTGITGYQTNVEYVTGYVPTGCFNSGYSYLAGTGITGYYDKYIGEREDGCGINQPIYVKTPLTGEIYGSGTVLKCTGSGQVLTPVYSNVALTGFLTGETFVEVLSGLCSGVTGYYPDYIAIDSGFVSSLGFDSIYSFSSAETINSNEAFFYTGLINRDNINLKPSYDSSLSDYIIAESKTGADANLIFNNGQLLYDGGGSSYTSGYSTLYNITGNIFLDGTVVRSNGYNTINDSLIYDSVPREGILFLAPTESARLNAGYPSGATFTAFTGSYTAFQNMYFLNGVKLLSGFDYAFSPSFHFKFDIPASSVLTRVVNSHISVYHTYLTGVNNLIKLNTGKFMKKTSQVYLNGLRQYPDEDYVEFSSFDLLSGNYRGDYDSLFFTSSDTNGFWNM